VRAARLLAEIGDARGRFPTADSLTCLAGVAPSTRQSGKVKAVTFRWAVDNNSAPSPTSPGTPATPTPWAADLYQRAIARGHDHPQAVRILARAWLHIIWRAWQDHIPYDPNVTAPSKPSSTKIHIRLPDTGVDTGHLMLRRTPGRQLKFLDPQL